MFMVLKNYMNSKKFTNFETSAVVFEVMKFRKGHGFKKTRGFEKHTKNPKSS